MIELSSANLANLTNVKQEIETELQFCVFTHPNKHLLFSALGRKKLQTLSDKIAYLHWDDKSSIIRIYGNAEQQQIARNSLVDVIKELEPFQLDKQFMIQRKYHSKLKEIVKESKETIPELLEIRFAGKRIVASGDNDAMGKLKTKLEQFIVGEKKEAVSGDCPFCFDELNDPYTFLMCKHSACLSCLGEWLAQELAVPIPLGCPCCSTPLVLRDIQTIASPADLIRIKEFAVAKFLEKNIKSYINCPKPGCPQYLPLPIQPTAQKGDSTYCDQCNEWYCLACSQKEGKQIKRHEGITCKEREEEKQAIADGTDLARVHRIKIADEFFTLHCPRCKLAFIDFSGCFALSCNCGCGFCAYCLQDCGSDAHSHVLQCSLNVSKSYFADFTVFQASHRNRIRPLLLTYLRNLDPALKSKVLVALQQDMTDLKIHVSEQEIF